MTNLNAVPKPLRCLGYARVSTEKQAGEVQTSISEQKRRGAELAERFGLTVERWYTDEGASGSTVEGRPAFVQLLADCEAMRRSIRDPGIIVVLDDSRFGRFDDPDEAAYWRHHLRRLGWIVRFAVGDDIEDVALRHIMRAVGGAQSTEERQKIRRRARQGIRGAAEQGFWTREAPFGYRRRVVYPPGNERILERGQLKAPNEKVALVPHEEEAAVVRFMFEAYATGEYSLTWLGAEAERMLPGKSWHVGTVRQALMRHAYVGDVVGGLRRRDAPPERYAHRNAHPPLVSRELFERVQQQLKVNAKRGPAVTSFYLLTGVLTCSLCGEAYIGGGNTSPGPDNDPRFYKDRGGVRGLCHGPVGSVKCSLIDRAVLAEIERLVRSKRAQRVIAEELDAALEAMREDGPVAVARMREQRARLQQKRDRLVAAIADGVLVASEAAGQLEQLRAQLEELDARIERARFEDRRAGVAQEERDRLLASILDFPGRIARLAGPALRETVLPWIGFARFDKTTRRLSLGLRRLPAVPGLLPLHPAGPVSREQVNRLVVRELEVRRDYRVRALVAGGWR